MASYNRVILVGNLTRDPSCAIPGVRRDGVGIAVNDRELRRPVGRRSPRSCDAVGCTAEIANEYLSEGSPVLSNQLKLTVGKRKAKSIPN
jgi:single-strand DNA-binding protein